jgi:hypothetical protein
MEDGVEDFVAAVPFDKVATELNGLSVGLAPSEQAIRVVPLKPPVAAQVLIDQLSSERPRLIEIHRARSLPSACKRRPTAW